MTFFVGKQYEESGYPGESSGEFNGYLLRTNSAQSKPTYNTTYTYLTNLFRQ
jgi:hypothetical protein